MWNLNEWDKNDDMKKLKEFIIEKKLLIETYRARVEDFDPIENNHLKGNLPNMPK
jgi:hypothetical protein